MRDEQNKAEWGADSRGEMAPNAQAKRKPANRPEGANDTGFEKGDIVVFAANGDEVTGEVKGFTADGKVTVMVDKTPYIKEPSDLQKVGK
jgi:hypothetical protein